MTGTSITRNATLAELEANVAISLNATVGLNYSGQYESGNRKHSGLANLRWRY